MSYLLQLITPQQMLAATVGPGTAKEEKIYHDCADCEAKAPEIAGLLSTTPEFDYVKMVVFPRNGLFKLAVFCDTCFAKRLAEAASNPQSAIGNPQSA